MFSCFHFHVSPLPKYVQLEPELTIHSELINIWVGPSWPGPAGLIVLVLLSSHNNASQTLVQSGSRDYQSSHSLAGWVWSAQARPVT